jgi:hypothetical protein
MTAWAIPAVTISAGSTTGWAVVTPARARVMTGFRPADEQSATVFEEMMSTGAVSAAAPGLANRHAGNEQGPRLREPWGRTSER